MNAWKALPLAGIIALIAVASCADDAAIRQEQEEIRVRLERTIDEIDRQTAELKEEVSATSDTVRQEMQARLRRLEDTRSDLQKKLSELGNTVGDKWDQVSADIEQSLEQARTALEETGEAAGGEYSYQ